MFWFEAVVRGLSHVLWQAEIILVNSILVL
jgi:hypothetical protein